MLKFFTGTAIGVLLAFVFVHYNWQPPAVLDLPEKLKKNVVSTAVEGDLYDLAAEIETRQRALEVYFKNRAGDAVKVDAADGHPFLNALYRARARREAGQVAGQWSGYDVALAKPALRGTLERKYGLNETDALKRAMLMDALNRKPFLKAWLEANATAVSTDNVHDVLRETAKLPDATAEAAP